METDVAARRLERLKREAEVEMRRKMDDSKRIKPGNAAPSGRRTAGTAPFVPVDRFRYAVVEELEAGAKGFIVTCNFRKEKSATREASQLLRRYMPEHLFPPPPAPAAAAASQADDREGAQQPGQEQTAAAAAAGAGAGTAAGAGAGAERQGRVTLAAVEDAQEEDVEEEADSDSEDESEECGLLLGGQDQVDGDAGAAAVAAAATALAAGGRGGAAADHHPEPSALGLAKVGCRGVVVMRLSSRAAAEVEPVRLLERLLEDLEAARAAQATAKQQKQQGTVSAWCRWTPPAPSQPRDCRGQWRTQRTPTAGAWPPLARQLKGHRPRPTNRCSPSPTRCSTTRAILLRRPRRRSSRHLWRRLRPPQGRRLVRRRRKRE